MMHHLEIFRGYLLSDCYDKIEMSAPNFTINVVLEDSNDNRRLNVYVDKNNVIRRFAIG